MWQLIPEWREKYPDNFVWARPDRLWLVLPLLLGVTLATSVVSVRLIPRRLQIASVFVAGCLVFGGLVLNHLHYPVYEQFTPSRAELDEVRQWLWKNPPDGKNRADRRKRMALIQKASEQLSSSVFDHEYFGDVCCCWGCFCADSTCKYRDWWRTCSAFPQWPVFGAAYDTRREYKEAHQYF